MDLLTGLCSFGISREHWWASLVAQLVKNPPAMQETPVQFPGQEDPLERDFPGSSDSKESVVDSMDYASGSL